MRNGEVSYWWQALGGFPARRASLPGPTEADVCIVGGGYTGHGVAAANLAGRTLADLVAGETSPLTTLPWVGHRSRTWEPEPARWTGVHGLYALYRLADRLEADQANQAATVPPRPGRVRLSEALARVGDVLSGILH